jgi:hypothetical protein
LQTAASGHFVFGRRRFGSLQTPSRLQSPSPIDCEHHERQPTAHVRCS